MPPRKTSKQNRTRRNPSSIPRPVPNPVSLSEDEADVIISQRVMREPGGITIQQYLAKHGLEMDRTTKTIRPKKSR